MSFFPYGRITMFFEKLVGFRLDWKIQKTKDFFGGLNHLISHIFISDNSEIKLKVAHI